MDFLKDPQNFFMQNLPLYTSYLFSIPSNFHVVDVKYLQEMRSPIIVVDDFSALFLQPFTFLISFYFVTYTNIGISPQNFLLLFLTLLPHWCTISRSYLVPVPNN